MALPTKVLVITGATSGIGLSFLHRILLEVRLQFLIRVCILCRNMRKGEYVRSTLLASHKSAEIELVNMDTGDLKSVLEGVNIIKEKYKKIDFLYLNAGILPVKKLHISGLFSRNVLARLKTGENIIESANPLNESGIPLVFATNVLGHFVLVQELLPLLRSDGQEKSKIVWTASNNAVKSSFNMDDFMCNHGNMSYGSSKYIINALSIAMNQRYNREGIYSHLAEPGLCITAMSENILPLWLWKIVEFLFMLFRLVAHHLTLSTYNGSESLIWLFKQDPRNLKKNYQYESAVNIFNQRYVSNVEIDISPTEAETIFQKMVTTTEEIRAEAG
ncbi:3-keto-steroid reductase/17-beta-hydroxysteroid dehydrogenase 7-like [Styela clava]